MFSGLLLHIVMCTLWSSFPHCADAVRFQHQCPVEVEESVNYDLICDGIASGETLTWSTRIVYQGSSTEFSDTCLSDRSCANTFPNVVKASRPSSGAVHVTIKSATRARWGGASVTCTTSSSAGVSTGTASCTVDVVYAARAAGTTCTIATSAGWTISGTCNITKVFSSLGNYTCDLRKGSAAGSSVAVTSYSPSLTGNPSYGSGSCSYTAPLPITSGSYSYVVIVHPGATAVTITGTISVARPSVDPLINCKGTQGQYIPEKKDLDCYCSASNLGQPKGRLRVYRGSVLIVPGSYGNGNETFSIKQVNRSDNRAVFKCVLDWATPDGLDRHTSSTVNVAYGPDTVSISDPGAFDLHPTSPSHLTLTCSASQSNPGVTFAWSSACVSSTSRTCSFTPTIGNNNDIVTCTVTNNATGTGPSPASRTLLIHYPPTEPPVITGYRGGPLYEGDTRNITCTVTGGNPPVAAVTFSCGGQGQEVSGTSRTITVTADRSSHGSTCTCRARWKTYNPSWYTQTAEVTLTVYYPPQPPSISHKNQDYPFMAGQSATLYCSFNSEMERGNPPATLTWRRHAWSSGQGEVNLTLDQLSSSDNGRIEVCEARNAFTDHNSNTQVTRQTVIDVYYLSDVSIISLPSDECDRSTTNTCVVSKGQRVLLNCSADSNPALATVAWQHSGGNILDLVANRSTSITQTCNITTEKKGDNRLPLRGNQEFTILVTYMAEIEVFIANNHSNNLIVNESDQVTFTCTVVGRPTPAMRIVKNEQQVADRPIGQISPEDTATLTHSASRAQCSDAGQYKCQLLDNGNLVGNAKYVTLLVNCGPRMSGPAEPAPPSVNYLGRPVQLSLDLEAFPLPDDFLFHFLGPGNNLSEAVARDQVDIDCWNTYAAYAVTCNITVDNIGPADAGYYSVQVRNDFGLEVVEFKITINEGEPIEQTRGSGDEPSNASVIGGAVAAVAAVGVVIAVVAIFLRRRGSRKSDPSLRPHEEQGGNGGDSVMIENDLYGTGRVYEASQSQRNQTTQRNDYEDVDVAKAKPVIQPKPKLGATAINHDGKDVYAVVTKGSKPHSAPAPSTDGNLYASVDKSKKTSPPSKTSPPGAIDDPRSAPQPDSQSVSNTKAKPKKDAKPPKAKKDKGKKIEQKDAVYSNSPLSMKPIDTNVYENYAFQNDETEFANNHNVAKSTTLEDSGTTHPDGLVYTTIAFSDKQQKKAEQLPPKRETSEYAGIDFTRQAPPAQD